MKTTYSEQLKDPRWQRKRIEIMQRDNFGCQLCGDTQTELHIHHKKYLKNKLAFEYDNTHLITYCKHCHIVTEYLKPIKIKKLIKFNNSFGRLFIIKTNDYYDVYFLIFDTNTDKVISVSKTQGYSKEINKVMR
jgi:hypothetical protein